MVSKLFYSVRSAVIGITVLHEPIQTLMDTELKKTGRFVIN